MNQLQRIFSQVEKRFKKILLKVLKQKMGLLIFPFLREGSGTTPAAWPAIEDVGADHRILDQRRCPVRHDIVGMVMGRVADRSVDVAAKGLLRDDAGTIPVDPHRLTVE